MSKVPPQPPRIRNRKASFRYEVLEKLEVGIALKGSEVKSLRHGRASLDEAYAMIREGQVVLRDCNISPYENAGYAQHAATRERRLLLRRREIRKLLTKVTYKGLTLIPLAMYFNERGLVKLQLALCRGKKAHDRRSDIQKREQQRDMNRVMKFRRL